MPASCSCQCPHLVFRTPRTRWWSAAGRSARGAPISCARRAWTGSSWSKRACSARARAAAPRAWSGSRAVPRRPCASGIWSRRFYLGQQAELGTDSGFVPQGYLLPCFTTAEVEAARDRLAMQSQFGIGAVWLDPDEVDAVNPALAPGQTLGGTFCADDGFISPPRNVAAYTVALLGSGVTVCERVTFRGLLAGWRPGARGEHQRRPGACAARRAHRRPEARGGRRPGRDPHSGRRGQAPGRGDGAAPRPARLPGAHGLRPARRAVLAARGGRPAVRDEQPRRAAGREPQRGLRLPGHDAGQAGDPGAGHRGPGPAPRLGGHHRLHPGPPADHRAGHWPGRASWPGSPWPARAAPG